MRSLRLERSSRRTGRLPDWVSAKDVILEILRRHDVDGGRGRIIEYHGPGVAELTSMDRHVITNMGVEVRAVTTIFPSGQERAGILRHRAERRVGTRSPRRAITPAWDSAFLQKSVWLQRPDGAPSCWWAMTRSR